MPPVDRERVRVVIAAFHEAGAIGEVVRGLVALGYRAIVVDDGSKDATGEVARDAGAVVLRHAVNRGQGAALQTGIDFAVRLGADAVVTFDADGQHLPGDLEALLGALDAGADVALGSRFLGTIEGATANRRALLRLSVRVSNALSGLALTDAHCGLRAIRAGALPKLRIRQDRMAHASELLRAMARARLDVREVPVTVRYTEYSKRKGQGAAQALRILFDYAVRR